MQQPFVSVFLGTSIDGCIAGEDGDLSWLAELAPDHLATIDVDRVPRAAGRKRLKPEAGLFIIKEYWI